MSAWETKLQLASKTGDITLLGGGLDRALFNAAKQSKSIDRSLSSHHLLLTYLKKGWVTRDCTFVHMVDLFFEVPWGMPPLQRGTNRKVCDKGNKMMPIQHAAAGGQTRLVEVFLALLVIRSILKENSNSKQRRILSKTRAHKLRSFPEWLKHVRYFRRTNFNEKQYEEWAYASLNEETWNIFTTKEYSLDTLVKLLSDPITPIHRFCTEPKFLSGSFSLLKPKTSARGGVVTSSMLDSYDLRTASVATENVVRGAVRGAGGKAIEGQLKPEIIHETSETHLSGSKPSAEDDESSMGSLVLESSSCKSLLLEEDYDWESISGDDLEYIML